MLQTDQFSFILAIFKLELQKQIKKSDFERKSSHRVRFWTEIF